MEHTRATEQIGAQDRFALRELIGEWNRRLDRSDLEGLRVLSQPGATIVFEGAVFSGDDGLRDFVAAHGATAEVARRTHVNHVQAWRRGDLLASRSMTMFVDLVAATSPSGDGSPVVSWVGYAEDEFVHRDGWRVVSRRFTRWGGEILRRFPMETAETA